MTKLQSFLFLTDMILGHSNIEGNEVNYGLAKQDFTGPVPALGRSIMSVRSTVRHRLVQEQIRKLNSIQS